MGIEWLYYLIGGGNSRSSTKRGRPPPPGDMKEAAASTSPGCMCAVFHLFHLQHFQFPSTQRNHSNAQPNTYPFLQEEATTTTTGVEAPRNSLELEETAAIKENLNFPVGIQIKTRNSKPSSSSPRISTSKSRILDDTCSECNSPSVVARLMGLDLLPQTTSPSISNSSKLSHRSFFDYDLSSGARSLPETPRVSSSSSCRRSDVERHRLSLQINKENAIVINQEVDVNRKGRFKSNKQDRRSVGLDITNADQYRRDEHLVVKKNSKLLSKHECSTSLDSKQSNVRIFLDHNKTKLPPSQQAEHHHPHQKHSKKAVISNGGKCSSAEEEFVRSSSSSSSRERNILNRMEHKSKRTPLSSRDNNILQVKKAPSPPPTKLPQKQSQVSLSDALSSKSSTQLSSKPSQPYNQLQLQRNKILKPLTTNGGATALHGGDSPAQRNHVQKIVKHNQVINPLTKWHSPSHPIDPGIFHHLELKAAAVLSHRCNKKLFFELVEELLADTSTTHFSLRRRISAAGEGGCFPLVEELCKKIESFPAAKCVVLDDIDSLIDRDLCKSISSWYLGEEEEMVCEIVGEIVEWLVHEAVAVMGGDAAEE